MTAGRTIRQQIRRLMFAVSAAMIVITVVLTMMLIGINAQYSGVLSCANTAADFNKEFKSTIDHEMYNHVIRPRSGQSEAELPMRELDDAETVLTRLSEETTLPDNRWRVKSMLDMCRNLRMYMEEIARTESYDLRMELLDRNIRGETGLTKLIENYMHDFLGDEVRELARLRGVINRQSTYLIIAASAAAALLVAMLLLYSVRVSRRITAPISALSEKAERFGADNFNSEPVRTDYAELKTLDRNFDRMADRITSLMEKQRQDQQSLHRAELELLQAQINPHFLYNTLDSIAILAESDRGEDVIDMVTSLSTFFRNSLNRGEDIISLRSELNQSRAYLEIQQIRYSDILTWSIDVAEEILDCPVPKLILQPLIENALYHGIKNRRGLGSIAITGGAEGESIVLRVRDNGAGMSPEQLAQLQSGVYEEHHSGLGLKNVHQRIRLYCGEPYGLSFESERGVGTTVTVRLPRGGVTAIRKGENEA
ncbi:MAG: sensor histidine kinase [Clostridia bacterium]|nr:sensor histidine kinase [Clostridia bacterium]